MLHVAPEAAIGGPLGLVRDGDPIVLDVPARRLTLDVPDDILSRRRAEWRPPAGRFERGYSRLYVDRVLQAPKGCDFDFLIADRPATEEEAAWPRSARDLIG